jgi:Annexin
MTFVCSSVTNVNRVGGHVLSRDRPSGLRDRPAEFPPLLGSKLLQAMGNMDMETRCKVPARYGIMFGGDDKTLMKVMKSECGKRDFGTALQFLAVDPCSAEAYMLEKAIAGFGTNELLLYTVVVGRSNTEMTMLKKKYFDIFTRDLGSALDKDLGRNFEALILNCLQANEEAYDPNYHNASKMADDCEQLYSMGQGKFGTNEKGLFKLLCVSPPEYLQKLNLLYADKYGYTIPKVRNNDWRIC